MLLKQIVKRLRYWGITSKDEIRLYVQFYLENIKNGVYEDEINIIIDKDITGNDIIDNDIIDNDIINNIATIHKEEVEDYDIVYNEYKDLCIVSKSC